MTTSIDSPAMDGNTQYEMELKRLEEASRDANEELAGTKEAILRDREVFRDSQQRNADILASIMDGLCELDQDWRFTYINQQAARNVGYKPEQLIGKNFWETFPSLHGTPYEHSFRQVMIDRQAVDFEITGVLSNQWFNIRVFPSNVGITCYWVDITERKTAEFFDQAINEIDQIIHSSLNYQKIMQRTISTAAKALESDTAALSFRQNERWIVNSAYGFPADIIGMEMDDQQELHAILAIQTKKPVVIHDALNDPRVNRSHLQKWGIRSVIVMPVLSRNEPIGVMSFNYQGSVFEFKQIHIDFVCKLAASLSLALENAQLYQNLKEEIRERRQIQKVLSESEARERTRVAELEALMDAVPTMIWVSHDPECRMVTGNRLGYKLQRMGPGDNLSKTSSEEVVARQPYVFMRNGSVIPPSQLPIQIATFTGQPVRDYEMDIVFHDGTQNHLLGNVNPLFDAEGNPAGAIGSFIDVTTLRQLQDQQMAAKAEIEVQLRLAEYREKERQEIAREIHDNPMQTLVGTLFNIKVAKEAVKDPVAQLEFAQIGLSLQDTIRELRNVVNELRPPSLIRFGFGKAIKVYLENFQEKHPGFDIHTDLYEDDGQISEGVRLALFRICQEGLNNIVRHSNATKVWLRFVIEDGIGLLEVKDNGKGMPVLSNLVDLTRDGHFGMAGMKERAEAVGGTFRVSSEPNQGTTVQVSVPIMKP